MPEQSVPNTWILSVRHITVFLCLGKETALRGALGVFILRVKSPTKHKNVKKVALKEWQKEHMCAV